jgi:hypothetical protein
MTLLVVVVLIHVVTVVVQAMTVVEYVANYTVPIVYVNPLEETL